MKVFLLGGGCVCVAALCVCVPVCGYMACIQVYIYTYVCMTCLDVYASYPSTSVHVSVQVNSCTEAKLSFFCTCSSGLCCAVLAVRDQLSVLADDS